VAIDADADAVGDDKAKLGTVSNFDKVVADSGWHEPPG
jgi:hypothetical protein